jgi:hypothetical protein
MSTTPTTRCTYITNDDLIHHALVQPRTLEDPTRCDLMVACLGFRRDIGSAALRPYDEMINCLSCLGTNWEITVAQMDRDGLLTKVESLDKDAVLHRILMEGKAFAESALRSNRR